MYQGRAVQAFFSNAASTVGKACTNFAKAPFTISADMEEERLKTLETVCPPLGSWLRECPNQQASFSCSEALWQSLKATRKEVWDMFHDDGALTKFKGNGDPAEAMAFLPFIKNDRTKAAKMYEHWNRKKMVGIIYKMAVNPKYAKSLGLEEGDLNLDKETLSMEDEKAVWMVILRLKFDANPELKNLLLSTGDKYLLEFDRSAAQDVKAPTVHWGGYIKDGVLKGGNVMGRYLMALRSAYCS